MEAFKGGCERSRSALRLRGVLLLHWLTVNVMISFGFVDASASGFPPAAAAIRAVRMRYRLRPPICDDSYRPDNRLLRGETLAVMQVCGTPQCFNTVNQSWMLCRTSSHSRLKCCRARPGLTDFDSVHIAHSNTS